MYFQFSANNLKTVFNKNYGNSKLMLQNIILKSKDHLSIGPIGKIHMSAKQTYPQVQLLPIPWNIDPTETTRFSPQRTRDITSNIILSHPSTIAITRNIDITVDNSNNNYSNNNIEDYNSKNHVNSYDCMGAISLNSSMQSNVPNPFGGVNNLSHLNMPGGQWEQGHKFMSHDLQSAHYTNLRKETRMNWSTYSDNSKFEPNISNGGGCSKNNNTSNNKMQCVVDNKKGCIDFALFNKNNICDLLLKQCLFHQSLTLRHLHGISNSNLQKINDSMKFSIDKNNKSDNNNKESQSLSSLSRKDKLKKAIKEYGATVIVFHVGISLVSLGLFYVLVSSGLDMVAILEYCGLGNSALSSKLAAGASTFVVAYAVHKIFAPVRISITLGATPFIVRYLRLKGFLKKTPT